MKKSRTLQEEFNELHDASNKLKQALKTTKLYKLLVYCAKWLNEKLTYLNPVR